MLLARDKKFYKELFRLIFFVSMQNIITYSVNMADNIMLGSYSQVAVSAAATVNQIQFMVQQAAYGGLTVALVSISSQYWGRQDTDSIRNISGYALKLGAAIGISIFAFALLIPDRLISLFTDQPDILSSGMEYLGIIKYTYLLFIFSTVLTGALRAVETVSIAFITSIISLIVNAGINYMLIFGRFGFPELGIRGAAIGTLIARALEFVIVIFYLLKVDKKLNFFQGNPFQRNEQLKNDYFRTVKSTMTNAVLWGLATPVQTGILGHLSSDAIAANSVSTTLFQYMKVGVMGEAAAANVSVGKLIGEGKDNREKLRPYVNSIQLIYILFALALGSVILAARKPLLTLYKLNANAMSLASSLIIIMALIFVFMAYQMPVSSGILQGGGDSRFIMRLNIVSSWLIVIPCSFLAAFWLKLPVPAVVLILNSDQIFKVVPMALRANGYKWMHKLTR